MNYSNHPMTKDFRRQLRHDETPTERMLWKHLRNKQLDGYRFRQQHGFGPYVLDFYCPSIRLCIELDGSVHDSAEQQQKDEERTEFLRQNRIHVLRLRNEEVEEDVEGALEKIRRFIAETVEVSGSDPQPPNLGGSWEHAGSDPQPPNLGGSETPQGFIFDYGGTLDTGGNHWGKVLWHAYERQRVPVSEQQFRDAYVHGERTLGRNPIIQPSFTFRQTLAEKLRLQLEYLRTVCDCPTETYASALLDEVYTQTQEHTRHSIEVLRQLKAQGKPMVLVSNFYGNVGVVLREFGFDGLFDSIVESAVVGVRKPDPRIFQLGVDALGLQPQEVVVVGDSIDKDIVPAHAIGCQTVWYEGEPWDASTAVDRTIPDLIINDLEQLL